MAEKIFVLGNSGTGKSTSLRNLNPEDTFILQCVNKKLPFKGWRSKYTKISKDNPNGNLSLSKNYDNLRKQLIYIHNKRKDIKVVIIDDSHYLMTGDFMNRITEKVSKGGGFEKYNQIAYNFYNLLELVENMRDDIIVFFIAHTQTNDDGTRSFKTVGKLLDNTIVLEGLATIILESKIREKKYVFQTNKIDGTEPCKAPLEMFEDIYIDNDLKEVINRIREYEN